MRLPNFLNHAGFTRLREEMGAELVRWNSVNRWTDIDTDKILDTIGVEVPIEEIEITPHGNSEKNGRHVVVYIRDQIRSISTYSSYRFHVADCQTLQKMRARGRYNRYVVATRTDGIFIVNFIQGGQLLDEGVECELSVCKNCLNRLNYRNYRDGDKYEIWGTFSLEEFFESYSSTITTEPEYTDRTSPLNVYSDDWNKISLQYRQAVNWTCEQCGLYLGEIKRFLQVHHINAQKNDNREQNLRALCIDCHAKMPQHHQLKYIPEYTEFLRWRNQQKLQGEWQS